MAKFTVEISEVWKRSFEVEIPDSQCSPLASGDPVLRTAIAELARSQANEKSEEGADDENFEYSHTLEPEFWTVRDEKGNYYS